MGLFQYNPSALSRFPYNELPGISTFLTLGKYFSIGLAMLDRTNTIITPVQMTSLFPIPAMRAMTKTFEEICNERAQELLTRADTLGTSISVFWSGGIDSTLALISLLKNATPEQVKRITVLMSEESISENPNFYKDHVHRKLRTDSVMTFPYLIGTKTLMVSGEQNDQLFGFDAVGKLINMLGSSVIHEPYTRDKLFDFFNASANNDRATNRFLDLFERLMHAAPIPIRSYFEYLWWINFSTKWQNTFMRALSCVAPRNVPLVTAEYVQTLYTTFYGTDDFQLWSLNNLDKRIKDEWRTYKWVCKDIIYDYTKDADYRDNKIKHGSLRSVVIQQHTYSFIDDAFNFTDTLAPEKFYVRENDFT